MTDRLTDHATRSVTIGGAHSGEAKFCYCIRLQQQVTSSGAVTSTDRINFSNQQLYSVVKGCTLQYSLGESVSHRRTGGVLIADSRSYGLDMTYANLAFPIG